MVTCKRCEKEMLDSEARVHTSFYDETEVFCGDCHAEIILADDAAIGLSVDFEEIMISIRSLVLQARVIAAKSTGKVFDDARSWINGINNQIDGEPLSNPREVAAPGTMSETHQALRDPANHLPGMEDSQ